jgi:hypothetical protein
MFDSQEKPMRKKCLSLLLMISLALTFCRSTAFGNVPPEGKTEGGTASDKERAARQDERLKATMLKLVADAKSESSRPAIRVQTQTPHSNHLSKKQKFAIGLGIAAAVVVVVGIIGWRQVRSAGSGGIVTIR